MKKGYRLFLVLFLLSSLGIGVIYYIGYIKKNIPDRIYLDSYSDGTINIELPFVGTVNSETDDGEAVAVSVNLMEPLTINSGQVSDYQLSVNLFGAIKIKDITVSVGESRSVVACGIPVGIYIETDGVYVVSTGDVITAAGIYEAPSLGILQAGDYICAVNDVEVGTIRELMSAIETNENDYVRLAIRRDGEEFEVKVKPVKDSEGINKIGVWVRDDCQGLGTLTYVDENDNFGTLGHAISDSQTGELVEIKSGTLYTAKIWNIVKGSEGTPGEVIGSINYSDENNIGDIDENCDIGVYGTANDKIFAYVDEVYMNVAYKQDIQEGTAYIRTFVCGDVKDYEIQITGIQYSDEYENKGIIFQVTDKELLEATNGIIQGMSGSPIIQNGKIIGAVTHVFVNEPEKGYGIFIENMLEH